MIAHFEERHINQEKRWRHVLKKTMDSRDRGRGQEEEDEGEAREGLGRCRSSVSIRPDLHKASSLARSTSQHELISDLGKLYNPGVKPPPLPFVRHSNAGIDGEWKGQNFKALVKRLLTDLFQEWSRTMAVKDFDAVEDWITCTKTYYIIRSIVPILVDGLDELLSTSEFIAARRKVNNQKEDLEDLPEEDASGKAALMPLNFLGCYLMRHNPNHPSLCNSKLSKARRRERQNEEYNAIVHDFFAELAVRRRLEARRALWETQAGKQLMNVWKTCCPGEKDELRLSHIRQHLHVFKHHLRRPSDETSEDLLVLLKGGADTGTVPFEQFELVVGNLLLGLGTMHAVVRPSFKARSKVTEWAKGKALKKLEQRLIEFDINPSEWFNEYSDPKTQLMTRQDAELCTKCIANKLALDLSSLRDAESAIFSHLASDEHLVTYDSFVRLVAELVRIVQKRAEAQFQRKAKTLFEARLAENIQTVQTYLHEIDRLDHKLSKLKRALADMQKSTRHIFTTTDSQRELQVGEPTAETIQRELQKVERGILKLAQRNQNVKDQIEQARKLTLGGGTFQGEREVEVKQYIEFSKAELEKGTLESASVEQMLRSVQKTFNERQALIARIQQAKQQRALQLQREQEMERLEQLQKEKELEEKLEKERQAREREIALLTALQKQKLQGEQSAAQQESSSASAVEESTSSQSSSSNASSAEARKNSAAGKRKGPRHLSKGDVSNVAKTGDASTLRSILEQCSPEDRSKYTNEKDKNGSTPLMHASWTGNLDCARVLVEFNGDPLATNVRLNTALHFAFERGHVEFAKFLLANGAEPALQMRNTLGKTPIDLNPVMRVQLRL